MHPAIGRTRPTFVFQPVPGKGKAERLRRSWSSDPNPASFYAEQKRASGFRPAVVDLWAGSAPARRGEPCARNSTQPHSALFCPYFEESVIRLDSTRRFVLAVSGHNAAGLLSAKPVQLP